MKNPKLFVVLVAAAMAAACGTAGQQASTQQASGGARASTPAVDDTVVTQRVQAALAADPEIAPTKIDVSAKQGRVSLKGEIKSMVQRKKAESIVRSVDGVRSVDNQLIITG